MTWLHFFFVQSVFVFVGQTLTAAYPQQDYNDAGDGGYNNYGGYYAEDGSWVATSTAAAAQGDGVYAVGHQEGYYAEDGSWVLHQQHQQHQQRQQQQEGGEGGGVYQDGYQQDYHQQHQQRQQQQQQDEEQRGKDLGGGGAGGGSRRASEDSAAASQGGGGVNQSHEVYANGNQSHEGGYDGANQSHEGYAAGANQSHEGGAYEGEGVILQGPDGEEEEGYWHQDEDGTWWGAVQVESS
jgi:hypothetical protein